MKKIFMIVAICALTAGMTISCKKDNKDAEKTEAVDKSGSALDIAKKAMDKLTGAAKSKSVDDLVAGYEGLSAAFKACTTKEEFAGLEEALKGMEDPTLKADLAAFAESLSDSDKEKVQKVAVDMVAVMAEVGGKFMQEGVDQLNQAADELNATMDAAAAEAGEGAEEAVEETVEE